MGSLTSEGQRYLMYNQVRILTSNPFEPKGQALCTFRQFFLLYYTSERHNMPYFLFHHWRVMEYMFWRYVFKIQYMSNCIPLVSISKGDIQNTVALLK